MPEGLFGSTYEQRLQREIEAINKKLQELTAEKNALERQLVKARQESAGVSDVNRRNSINRVMIERRLVGALQMKPIMTNAELFEQAKLVAFDLNPNTFRTHLHRLKSKGTIEPTGLPGQWRLPTRLQGVFG